MKGLTQERLKELLTYNKYTKSFTWNVSQGNRSIGSTAGNYRLDRGYRRIAIDKKLYYVKDLIKLYLS